MNIKEVAEIRRHARRERSNITALYGCFVNAEKEIISQFRQSIATMPENEADQFFRLFKLTLTGEIDKRLINIAFTTKQVAEGEKHKLLMDLRDNIEDDELRTVFFQKIVQSIDMDKNYLILLGRDFYDVPFKRSDGTFDADGDRVYEYLQCAICPVKLSKPAIEYKAIEKEFHNSAVSQILSAPILGFTFPAFDNRETNIYNALMYTKNIAEGHEEFIEAVFGTEPFSPAEVQKATFSEVLRDTLKEDCTMEVIQSIYSSMSDKMEFHKESRDPNPVTICGGDVESMLISAGVNEEKAKKVGDRFEEKFGEEVSCRNIIDSKKFLVKTPTVSIRVDPKHKDTLQTRVVGGVSYIMIAVDETVEVNGVPVVIEQD